MAAEEACCWTGLQRRRIASVITEVVRFHATVVPMLQRELAAARIRLVVNFVAPNDRGLGQWLGTHVQSARFSSSQASSTESSESLSARSSATPPKCSKPSPHAHTDPSAHAAAVTWPRAATQTIAAESAGATGRGATGGGATGGGATGAMGGGGVAATCAASRYLGAPVRERCNISKWVDNGPHAHCAGTVNENADVNDGAAAGKHAWLPDDVLVPWPRGWR